MRWMARLITWVSLEPYFIVGNILEEINRQGTTIVMATHNREIVNTLKHRLIAIEDGRIIRDEAEGVYDFEA